MSRWCGWFKFSFFILSGVIWYTIAPYSIIHFEEEATSCWANIHAWISPMNNWKKSKCAKRTAETWDDLEKITLGLYPSKIKWTAMGVKGLNLYGGTIVVSVEVRVIIICKHMNLGLEVGYKHLSHIYWIIVFFLYPATLLRLHNKTLR